MINTKIKAYQTELLNKLFSLNFLSDLFDKEQFEDLLDEISYPFNFEIVEAFLDSSIDLPSVVVDHHNQVKSRLGLYTTKWIYDNGLTYSFGYSSEDPQDLSQCAAIIGFIRYLIVNNHISNLTAFVNDKFLITQNPVYELIFSIQKNASVADSDKFDLSAYPSLNLSFNCGNSDFFYIEDLGDKNAFYDNAGSSGFKFNKDNFIVELNRIIEELDRAITKIE